MSKKDGLKDVVTFWGSLHCLQIQHEVFFNKIIIIYYSCQLWLFFSKRMFYVSVVEESFADHAIAITVEEKMSATYTGKNCSFKPKVFKNVESINAK